MHGSSYPVSMTSSSWIFPCQGAGLQATSTYNKFDETLPPSALHPLHLSPLKFVPSRFTSLLSAQYLNQTLSLLLLHLLHLLY